MERFGNVTRNPEECEEFDLCFYEVNDVVGRSEEPRDDCHNMVSVFGDNAAVEENPGLAPVDSEGRRAVRDDDRFDWDYVCPTSEYRDEILSYIEDCDVGDGVRLDTLGFPREDFCRCERCTDEFEASSLDWEDWRASVITETLESAAETVSDGTDLSLTLYPDPSAEHQYERFGLDLERADEVVDFYVVPIYDMNYSTTYWLETLAWNFDDLLDSPFYVELYAPVEKERLEKATEVSLPHSDGVLYAYDDEMASEMVEEYS
ncbi:MAG: hypothetical protein SV253_07695 [Halobacteria archaeon]|nr:hypothetical protein [Halobacteria archaeon]